MPPRGARVRRAVEVSAHVLSERRAGGQGRGVDRGSRRERGRSLLEKQREGGVEKVKKGVKKVKQGLASRRTTFGSLRLVYLIPGRSLRPDHV